MRFTLWTVAVACLMAGVALGVPLLARVLDPLGFEEQRSSIEARLQLGLSEQAVVQALGQQPAFRYERETAPADYYVSGWARRERGISGSVLVFTFGEPICYVWFDDQGRVEDYFIGSS